MARGRPCHGRPDCFEAFKCLNQEVRKGVSSEELTMQDEALAEASIKALVASGNYKVLRRLQLPVGPINVDCQATTSVGLVVDVETTGLDPARHKIIELGVRRFRYNDKGEILRLDHPYNWLEDPGEPLDPLTTALTGLTDEMVAGQTIDDRIAGSLFRSAEICIAHNAAFDRLFIDRRLPDCAEMAWACSLQEVDWRRRGFDGTGRALGWLLTQCGWFNEAHRTEADVDAVLAILQHESIDGTTALAELLANANQPSWLISAVGAHFDVKDSLKARGYRWNGNDTVWYRHIADAVRDEELAWLADNVYAERFRPRMDGPSVREITRFTRYS